MVPQNVIPQDMVPQNVIPQNVVPENVIPQHMIPEDVVPQDVIPDDMVALCQVAVCVVVFVTALVTANLALQRRQQGADDTVSRREMRPGDLRGACCQRAWDVDQSGTLLCATHAAKWSCSADQQGFGL